VGGAAQPAIRMRVANINKDNAIEGSFMLFLRGPVLQAIMIVNGWRQIVALI
jgi:hypothetical protein